ncbi:hypothetical protein AKJ44_02480 [candidate division MSBL1 archaeon SCGC-AAA261F17]|uniref:PD-(D/E)XK endonuclease-like domain-containing protein n=1 Tax=candidate division MSBL1 archaeon SCGC-AAA261F17 TaxID=1698274 RepID=A0A133V4W3_9EURY|nr:hypothetical protein AKJ44_02480 [candidate division MSBL1 archaeon SCGC-AAA261F17]
MEHAFFISYLEDRLNYSRELGYIEEDVGKTAPLENSLEIGDDITFDDIESLLEKREALSKKDRKALVIEKINQLGGKPLAREIENLLKCNTSPSKVTAKIRRLSPKIQGRILEWIYAERCPSIRWNFDWEGYVVVGVPEGITDEFVYEFKTTRKESYLKTARPPAIAQADLYGHFFKRKKKRVQFMIRETEEILTWKEKVDRKNALNTLKNFEEVERGLKEPFPPADWKCRVCKYRNKCKKCDMKLSPRIKRLSTGLVRRN